MLWFDEKVYLIYVQCGAVHARFSVQKFVSCYGFCAFIFVDILTTTLLHIGQILSQKVNINIKTFYTCLEMDEYS